MEFLGFTESGHDIVVINALIRFICNLFGNFGGSASSLPNKRFAFIKQPVIIGFKANIKFKSASNRRNKKLFANFARNNLAIDILFKSQNALVLFVRLYGISRHDASFPHGKQNRINIIGRIQVHAELACVFVRLKGFHKLLVKDGHRLIRSCVLFKAPTDKFCIGAVDIRRELVAKRNSNPHRPIKAIAIEHIGSIHIKRISRIKQIHQKRSLDVQIRGLLQRTLKFLPSAFSIMILIGIRLIGIQNDAGTILYFKRNSGKRDITLYRRNLQALRADFVSTHGFIRAIQRKLFRKRKRALVAIRGIHGISLIRASFPVAVQRNRAYGIGGIRSLNERIVKLCEHAVSLIVLCQSITLQAIAIAVNFQRELAILVTNCITLLKGPVTRLIGIKHSRSKQSCPGIAKERWAIPSIFVKHKVYRRHRVKFDIQLHISINDDRSTI